MSIFDACVLTCVCMAIIYSIYSINQYLSVHKTFRDVLNIHTKQIESLHDRIKVLEFKNEQAKVSH